MTYTLRYNRAPFLSVERLREHYQRAVVEIVPDADGETVRITAENVAVLGVDRRLGEQVRFGEQVLLLRPAVGGLQPLVYYRATAAGWSLLDYEQARHLQENVRPGKAPGLQGPIDDAFRGPFLCVCGTSRPWNPAVQEWAEARLEQFANVWDKFLRSELPVKDDKDVTPEDIERCHLVLFGDPGSNLWIERLAKGLPLTWTREEIRLGGASYTAAEHAPALIALNPQNRFRYVVINSGHTFGAAEFAGSNALLYPRLGDFGVFRLSSPEGEVVTSGFFDESFR